MKRLMDDDLAQGEHRLDIDVSGLVQGIYFVVLNAEGQRTSRKLVILSL